MARKQKKSQGSTEGSIKSSDIEKAMRSALPDQAYKYMKSKKI